MRFHHSYMFPFEIVTSDGQKRLINLDRMISAHLEGETLRIVLDENPNGFSIVGPDALIWYGRIWEALEEKPTDDDVDGIFS